jgi:D-glycero-D-manno-heptose 1,7-bisphosphate phosphatase
MSKSAVFLDRDGVINFDKGYVYKISDFKWIDGAKEAIKFLKSNNYYIFVVTNQSGIARGYYSEGDVKKLHNFINNELRKIHTSIDDFFYSPFHPDISNNKYLHLENLRKPKTGMLEIAQKKWHLDKKNSFLIGDKKSDLECAENFGIKGYLFEEDNLLKFVKKIIS